VSQQLAAKVTDQNQLNQHKKNGDVREISLQACFLQQLH